MKKGIQKTMVEIMTQLQVYPITLKLSLLLMMNTPKRKEII